jgi:hypothetical protein
MQCSRYLEGVMGDNISQNVAYAVKVNSFAGKGRKSLKKTFLKIKFKGLDVVL